LRLNTCTTIANSTTTVGPQMPPFSSSGSGAFTGSCSGGRVSTGGAVVVGVSTSGSSTGFSSTGILTFSSFTIAL